MDNKAPTHKLVIDNWNTQVSAVDKALAKLTDEQLMTEVAPGRNRGIYLLGHLTAVNDMMLPLLRFGPARYPALPPVFIEAPDRTVAELPSAATLREQWKAVNDELTGHLRGLSDDAWAERHASISEEDFAKEPHRNRMNVLLSRMNHLSYHRGQLMLLVGKD